ncbi:hypothetical protein [Turneriella parva]|uniref:Outer membrane protein beta-barrel domain-containing protein n=1 Tax=Turneriella parva (strain ATCC BAA-1111 / DSM 21527 / NCTC 11395 / H) TaxID=869212 RepID=I4BAF2_TURPD|nr:hypothetical protein [Turneriella parva]AFM14259.1 hypothetical protein Turpa_3625 [Turneriella parva DSM 21527]
MDLLAKLRRGINRISLALCLAATGVNADANYLVAVGGSYSMATAAMPAGLEKVYSNLAPEYNFTDYGGKVFFVNGGHGFGGSLGLVSAMNARALSKPGSAIVDDALTRMNTTFGGSHQLSSGKYSLGLAWVPLLARYRFNFVDNLLFIEAGAGPAYGFGALESLVTATNGADARSENRYHKFNEWGFMTNLTLGANINLAAGLDLQVFAEGAWLYAEIRSPNLLVSDSVVWQQYFFRPGLAVALSF